MISDFQQLLDLNGVQYITEGDGRLIADCPLCSEDGRQSKLTIFPENTRWELLKRAITAESKIEAIFVKVSTERNLSEDNLKQLGLFRQCYQQLRQNIRDNEEIAFAERGIE
jgi:hypothetical protein